MRFGEAVAYSPDGGRCFAERTVTAAVASASAVVEATVAMVGIVRCVW